MMRKIFLGIIFLGVFVVAKAQQTPQFTQYNNSRYIINPAATGENEYLTGVVGYRKQWAGFGEEPTTVFAGGHIGIRKHHLPERQPLALRTSRPEAFHSEQKEGHDGKYKHGIGAYLMGDSYGAFKKNTFGLSYALHIPVSSTINLSLGANGSFNQMKFDQAKATPTEMTDQTYQNFVDDRGQISNIDMNFGVYLYSVKFFFGYATNQLLGDNISLGSTNSNPLALHHSIVGGYHYQYDENLMFTPSIYFKAVGGAPLSYDFNFRTDYKKVFGALSYRNQDAIALMLGMYFNDNISLAYSYDVNTSKLKKYNGGGHEIVLGIGLQKSKQLEQIEE